MKKQKKEKPRKGGEVKNKREKVEEEQCKRIEQQQVSLSPPHSLPSSIGACPPCEGSSNSKQKEREGGREGGREDSTNTLGSKSKQNPAERTGKERASKNRQ